uniref:Uncharacterized protein n=1 Tax=Brassica oleracea var. oleracea TaxID=109376 RepID=A0A0D3CW60_BRAOL
MSAQKIQLACLILAFFLLFSQSTATCHYRFPPSGPCKHDAGCKNVCTQPPEDPNYLACITSAPMQPTVRQILVANGTTRPAVARPAGGGSRKERNSGGGISKKRSYGGGKKTERSSGGDLSRGEEEPVGGDAPLVLVNGVVATENMNRHIAIFVHFCFQ